MTTMIKRVQRAIRLRQYKPIIMLPPIGTVVWCAAVILLLLVIYGLVDWVDRADRKVSEATTALLAAQAEADRHYVQHSVSMTEFNNCLQNGYLGSYYVGIDRYEVECKIITTKVSTPYTMKGDL